MKAAFIKNLALGMAVTLVFFVVLELILMVAGVTPLYDRSDTSVGFSGYAPLFVKYTEADGERVFRTAKNKLQWFNMQAFPVSKAGDVKRVFCLGGSTTYGRPYDDRTSFCGWLRRFLPAADTTCRWEVINAGGISYASYRVARLMEELAEYEPDLFIVYTGHNEFLESRTYSDLLEVPVFLRSLAVQASRTRLFTLLFDLFNRHEAVLPTEVDALLDNSVGPEDYHRDDELREIILGEYRNSLVRMTEISERAGADLILVTPASNIRDFSPFKSEPADDLDGVEVRRADTLRQAAATALEKGDYAGAEALAGEALSIDGRDPALLYLRAQALLGLDRMEEARTAFVQSRDEDICPLRALTPFREIVAGVAAKEGAGLVDFARIVNKHSPGGIPGSELFLDHVHPTIEGNRLLALSILREMKEEGIVSPAAAWDEAAIEEISRDLENSLDEKTHARALRKLSRVLTWAGKHEEAERLLNQALTVIPDDREAQVQKGVLLWREGDKEAALVHYREAVNLDPMIAGTHRSLGVLLSELGRMVEARAELEESIRLDPQLDHVHYDLGIVLQALGMMKEAEAAYRTALEKDPGYADACNNLGVVLARGGRLEEARDQFARAVELDPDHQEAAGNLARARMALGR